MVVTISNRLKPIPALREPAQIFTAVANSGDASEGNLPPDVKANKMKFAQGDLLLQLYAANLPRPHDVIFCTDMDTQTSRGYVERSKLREVIEARKRCIPEDVPSCLKTRAPHLFL